jgi:hypothetical protein
MQHTSTSEHQLVLLERHAGKPFARRDDVRMILEAAVAGKGAEALDRLSFLAKFLVRAHGIMTRIGRQGEGYDRLAAEFAVNMEEARTLLREFATGASGPSRPAFEARYLAMTPGALEEILILCRDLSWYKNWRIDHPDEPAWKEAQL